MNAYRQVSIQLITNNNIKLNKVAVENNWNPYEIKWKGTNSTKVKPHVTNKVAVNKAKFKQQHIILLSLITWDT